MQQQISIYVTSFSRWVIGDVVVFVVNRYCLTFVISI